MRSRVSSTWPDLGLFQVYMFKCVWRCYRIIKYINSAQEMNSSKTLQKVSLVGDQVPVLPFIVTFVATLSPLLSLSFFACKIKVRPCEDFIQL